MEKKSDDRPYICTFANEGVAVELFKVSLPDKFTKFFFDESKICFNLERNVNCCDAVETGPSSATGPERWGAAR
jgi:hypothetical protein